MVEWNRRGYIEPGVWNQMCRKVDSTVMAPLQHLPQPPHPPGLVGFMFEVGPLVVYKLTIINIGNLKGHPGNSPTPWGPNFLRFLWVSREKLSKISSGSSGRVEVGWETWNLCGSLRRPSFLWLIFTGPGAMAPSASLWIRYWFKYNLATPSLSPSYGKTLIVPVCKVKDIEETLNA